MRFLTTALLLLLTALYKMAVVVVVWADDGIDDLFLDEEVVDEKVVDEEVDEEAVDNDDVKDDNGTDRTDTQLLLRLEFVPAVLYQQTLHQEHDKLFFLPQNNNNNIPNTTTMVDDGCWYQCVADICQTVCGGTFTVDYSMTDVEAIQFIFTFAADTLLRPAASDPRIRVAVFAQTIDCTDGELLLNKFVTANQVDYVGGNVTGLVDHFDPDKSFVQITRCSIASKLELIAPDEASLWEANVTSIAWTIPLDDNARVRRLGEQTYFYDTTMPLWIEVPSDVTSAPTAAPAAIATIFPTNVVIPSQEEKPTGSSDGAAAAISGGSMGSWWTTTTTWSTTWFGLGWCWLMFGL